MFSCFLMGVLSVFVRSEDVLVIKEFIKRKVVVGGDGRLLSVRGLVAVLVHDFAVSVGGSVVPGEDGLLLSVNKEGSYSG